MCAGAGQRDRGRHPAQSTFAELMGIVAEHYRVHRCYQASCLMEDSTVGAILLWLIGIPLPIIIILLLLWH
jgi:hypothetical protein